MHYRRHEAITDRYKFIPHPVCAVLRINRRNSPSSRNEAGGALLVRHSNGLNDNYAPLYVTVAPLLYKRRVVDTTFSNC